MIHAGMSAEDAIEELFALYADDIYRYARYSIPNADDAKDVVQEVFLKAFRAWGNFRQDSSPKTWLLHIARNHMYDMLRKKRTETEYQKQHKPDLSELSVPLETFIELEDAISSLKPAFRQVFTLRCVQDLTVAETAEILGWSEAKVKTTLHRAIKDLQAILGDDFDAPDQQRKGGALNERRGESVAAVRSARGSEVKQRR